MSSTLISRPADLPKRLARAVIRLYQITLSPYLGRQCRFYPSCSHYALEAIERHGVVHGSGLAVRRLLRCQPFHPGGVDLVPETAEAPKKES
ncbi:MAG: membrane protein insertion efficiency factor YidD [Gammaproteobacteria bacterium]|nr:membrane protein insertion efficiency factor YidD [Gammaproteobacteria bacterium]